MTWWIEPTAERDVMKSYRGPDSSKAERVHAIIDDCEIWLVWPDRRKCCGFDQIRLMERIPCSVDADGDITVTDEITSDEIREALETLI